jgi:hypothetical protein
MQNRIHSNKRVPIGVTTRTQPNFEIAPITNSKYDLFDLNLQLYIYSGICRIMNLTA